MAITSIDELNIIRSEPYENYFAVMDITDEQESRRIAFAERMEMTMLYFLTLYDNMREYGNVNQAFLEQELANKFRNVIKDFGDVDEELQAYSNDFAKLIVATTLAHADDKWFTSVDRAMFVAENEANTILNHIEYTDAVGQGKMKRWHTILDNHARETHMDMSGVTIPAEDVFEVGGSYMRYPKDVSLGAEAQEIVNCRCSVQYI